MRKGVVFITAGAGRIQLNTFSSCMKDIYFTIWLYESFQFYRAGASGLRVPVSDFTWLLFKPNYECWLLTLWLFGFALKWATAVGSGGKKKKKTDVLLLYIKRRLRCASVALWKQGYVALVASLFLHSYSKKRNKYKVTAKVELIET